MGTSIAYFLCNPHANATFCASHLKSMNSIMNRPIVSQSMVNFCPSTPKNCDRIDNCIIINSPFKLTKLQLECFSFKRHTFVSEFQIFNMNSKILFYFYVSVGCNLRFP